MTQKFYLRNITATNTPTAGEKSTVLPVSTLGANNAAGTQETRSLLAAKGASQTSHAFNSDATTSARDNYMGRFTSNPLGAGTFGSGNWSVALALSENNVNANSFHVLSIYFWRPSNNTVVGFVYDSHTAIGAAEWVTTESGKVNTISGANVTISSGDVLVLEVWRSATQAMATAYSQTVYYDGTTDVTDGAGTADAASYINAPADIVENISKTLTGKYDITNVVNKTLTALYDITNIVAKTLTGKYDLVQIASKTLTGKYDLFQNATSVLTAKYDITNIISNTITGLYDIKNTISNTLSALYDVFQNVSNTLTGLYDILSSGTPVSNTITALYDINNTVSNTFIGIYNVLNKISNTFIGLFDIRQTASNTISGLYDIRNQVNNSLIATYDVLLSVNNSLIGVFDIKNRVSNSLIGVFDMMMRVSRTLRGRYRIISDNVQVKKFTRRLRILRRFVPQYHT